MNKIKKYEIIGIFFTIILGTLLHFTYQWSGENHDVALFSAVNESTWEHLKLLFFPYIIYSIIEYFYIGQEYSNYATAKTLGILSGLIAIPIIFYTYTAILGDNYLILDILTFILGVILSYAVSYYILGIESIKFNGASIVITLFLIYLFFIFTFNPPQSFLFMDPTTNTYGLAIVNH